MRSATVRIVTNAILLAARLAGAASLLALGPAGDPIGEAGRVRLLDIRRTSSAVSMRARTRTLATRGREAEIVIPCIAILPALIHGRSRAAGPRPEIASLLPGLAPLRPMRL